MKKLIIITVMRLVTSTLTCDVMNISLIIIEDSEIYNECRTVANTGMMNIIQNIANTVADDSKAYSSAFCKTYRIPMMYIFLVGGTFR